VTPLRTAFVTASVFAVSLLLARVHPFGDAGLFGAPSARPSIPDGTGIPADVRAILTTKCADCHSAQTHSRIYGHFAPISWLMERDVLQGRKHMNLSQWDSYSPDQRPIFKAMIVQQTKSHDMPLLQYRMIHWSASITPTDIQALTQWAHNPATGAADSAMADASNGDPVRGAALFEKRCTGCHALTQNHEGPQLKGVYGRTTGSVPGFPYSDALKKANVTWNDQSLEKWLTDPDAFLPGNNMDFLVAKPQERADLIAYFKKSAGK
jgi:cytochrome c